MVDFRFYLNKQGIRGQKGEKGDTGFSPSIVEEVNTLTDYRLKIINEFDEFVTDNLRGSDYFDITDPNGTYLRFDKETGRAYTGALDQATSEAVGGARLASTSDMEAFSENTIVTPALFADSLANLIVSPDGSLNITQNEQTSKTEIRFNSSTLDAVRAEIERVKQDLATEAQVRLNADNQQQVAIDAERRERETQDAALQNQLNTKLTVENIKAGSNVNITRDGNNITINSTGEPLPNNLVTTDTNQEISGTKTFRSPINFKTAGGSSQGSISTGTFGTGVTISGNNVRLRVADSSITQLNFDGTNSKLLNQDNIISGDNITVEKTTNGVKISSTGGAGAIIDDENPAIDKVYSSSKTSDLVGELGNEVNSIAGRLNTLEGEVKVATTENLGLVQPDGTTITIDSDGKITAVGGGVLPDNLVTTDTEQTISGIKTYKHRTLRIENEEGTMYSAIADFLTDSIGIGKDGTSAISDRLKMAKPTVGNFYKEKAEIVMGASGLEFKTWISKVLSVDDIKAGNNIQLTKDESSGEVTISATGGGGTPEVDNVTIEINEDGKLQTTVDINELQSKVEDLQLYKFPNATIEGDPTINNGQVSNFSTTNYLRFPFEFETKGRTWLLNGSFDTGSDVTTQQNIIDSLASVALAVRSGRLVLALSTNGTSFDLGEHLSMSDIEPNTKYYFKLSFSGTQYLLSLSTDKIDYMPEVVVSSTSPIASRPMTISSSGHPYGDIINLNDWDLTVGNVLVWQGMDDVGVASRLDVNVSNVTETGKQAIKDIVNVDGKQDKFDIGDGLILTKREYGSFVNLTSNGTIGGDKAACIADSYETGYQTYYAFDGNPSSYAGFSGTSNTNRYVTYYSPVELLVTSIDFNFKSSSEMFTAGTVSFSNDNVNWKESITFTNNQLNFNLDTSNIKTGYKYIRINNLSYNGWSKYNITLNCSAGKMSDLLAANIDNETIVSDNGVLKAVGGGSEDISEALYILTGGDSTLLDTKLDKTTPHIIEMSDPSLLPTYYIVYSNGWCEHGGKTTQISQTINLLKRFRDTNGNAICTPYSTTTPSAAEGNPRIGWISESSIFVTSGSTAAQLSNWKVCGYLAEGEY